MNEIDEQDKIDKLLRLANIIENSLVIMKNLESQEGQHKQAE